MVLPFAGYPSLDGPANIAAKTRAIFVYSLSSTTIRVLEGA